jgi:hypothetical protein
MKWILFLFVLIASNVFGQTPFKGSDYTFYYQINIGKTNGSLTTPSAWLEIGKDSTTKGMRVPRVVDTTAISSPIYGLVVYQITDDGIYFRDKFGWRRLSDAITLNNYLLKSDSTTYYPYHTNPKSYVVNELDPVANSKTVTINTGTGLLGGTAATINTNPSFSLTADNTTALWNANAIRGIGVSASTPTSGQILQYNGSQYTPVTFSPSGTVTSVGLALPGIFAVTGSPVTTSGTLTGSFNNQLANVVFAGPNGSSGQPFFRSLTNTDLPVSPVTPGTYGADTISTIITVNSKGIVTNITPIPIAISWDSVRRKPFTSMPTLEQVTNAGNVTSHSVSIGKLTAPIRVFDVHGDIQTVTPTGGAAFYISTATNIPRWSMGVINTEGILNSGADFRILRYDSVGGIIGTLLTATRANGNIGIGTGTPTEKLELVGNIIAAAPAYSSGGISSIGRNNTTGRFETFIPSPNGFTTTTDANYTVQSTDRYVVLIHTTALRTLTLPNPVGISGQELWIRCAANGSGEWQTGATGFINGGQIGTPPFVPVANQPFSSNSTTHLISDGTNWYCFQ